MKASSQLFVFFLTIIPKNILLDELQHEKSLNNFYTTFLPSNIGRNNLLNRKVYCVKQNLPISCCTGPKSTKDYLIIRKSVSKKCTLPNCKEKCAALNKKIYRKKRMKTKTNRRRKKTTHCKYNNHSFIVQRDKNIGKKINNTNEDMDKKYIYGSHNNQFHKVKVKSASEKTSLIHNSVFGKLTKQEQMANKNISPDEGSNSQKLLALSQMKVLISNDDNFGDKSTTETSLTKIRYKKYDDQSNIIDENLGKTLPKYVAEFLQMCKSLMDIGSGSNSNNNTDTEGSDLINNKNKFTPDNSRYVTNRYVLLDNKYASAKLSSNNENDEKLTKTDNLIKDKTSPLLKNGDKDIFDLISVLKHPRSEQSLKSNESSQNLNSNIDDSLKVSLSSHNTELPVIIYPYLKIPLKGNDDKEIGNILRKSIFARLRNSDGNNRDNSANENTFGSKDNSPSKSTFENEFLFLNWTDSVLPTESCVTTCIPLSTQTYIIEYPAKTTMNGNLCPSRCATTSCIPSQTACLQTMCTPPICTIPTECTTTETCPTTTTECTTTETCPTTTTECTTTEICPTTTTECTTTETCPTTTTKCTTTETCPTTTTKCTTTETCPTTTTKCTTTETCPTTTTKCTTTETCPTTTTCPTTIQPRSTTTECTTSTKQTTKCFMSSSNFTLKKQLNSTLPFSRRPSMEKQITVEEVLKSSYNKSLNKPLTTVAFTITSNGTVIKQNKVNSIMSSFSKLVSRSPFTKKFDARNETLPLGEDFIIPYDNSTSVEEYVEYLNKKCENIHRKYRRTMWDFETNITHQTRKKSMVTSLEMTQFQKNLNEVLQPLKSLPVNNPNLERQIKLLYLPGMASLPDYKITEFEQVLYAMTTIYNAATVSEWQSPLERVSVYPVIANRMAKSRDPDELKYYWLEWRKASGKRIRSLYEQYVELMDLTAKSNGFSDAGEMWTRRYETEDFMQLLGSHWEDMRPLYNELHAYVRHGLHQTYGAVNNATDTGTIPVHLTGDLWGEDWRNLYQLLAPYHDDVNYMDMDLMEKEIDPPALLPTMNNVVAAIRTGNRKKFTVRKMVNEAEKMFHSLGFQKLPTSFWNKSIFVKSNVSEMTCQPSVWDMLGNNDYRMKFCGKSTMEDFFKIHEMLAKIEYFVQYQNLSYPFREAANPSFGDAIAGAIALSAKSRRHLETINMIPRQKRIKEADINFLVRMALEKVASLPYSYIIDLWRHRVFQGEISNSEYNEKWWDLRTQYQGVSPPVERNEEDFDIGSKLEVAANKPYIKYFLSTLMEFQIHEALCEQAGHKGDLYNCDITSSAKSGKKLRKVMSMGASQHWRIALKVLTGERRLESGPMLRYFQPLYTWLKERNNEDGQHSGWQTS